jgi:division protein 1
MGPLEPITNPHYHAAMAEVHKQLQRPTIQRSMFSMARTTPRDLIRTGLSTSEIGHRALTYLPDSLLADIPDTDNSYSLFQGFQATHPDLADDEKSQETARGRARRRTQRGRQLLEDASPIGGRNKLEWLKKEQASMMHELELLGIRKNLATSEIRDIDNKIANLHDIRNLVLNKLSGLEQEEAMIEHDLIDLDNRAEAAQLLFEEEESESLGTPTATDEDPDHDDSGFMSQSIYEKIPSLSSTPSRGRKRSIRRKSMPVLHEHYEPGTSIRSFRAHQDNITSLDFDAPFGTLVTAALDDSVRVWDLSSGRSVGALEGHTASVRALQVEDNILATGSLDATIRLWDLSKALYDNNFGRDDDIQSVASDDLPEHAPIGTMDDCPLFTLQAHVDAVTALHFRGETLVSGAADKTLRQWDLVKGRCVQTLDVMWAAAQATNLNADSSTGWRHSSRVTTAESDFVGSLQVFDAALACGTADGMVRLWDLRSGQVHRSLVGHTGPVTALQFDDVHLVTTSLDRSVRIWDLRTGSIYDAYAYDHPITSMTFDARRIVCAASEDVVKVYDKAESVQWDCGAGTSASEDDDKPGPSIVERVRVRDGYLVEGRQDGRIGVWTC